MARIQSSRSGRKPKKIVVHAREMAAAANEALERKGERIGWKSRREKGKPRT